MHGAFFISLYYTYFMFKIAPTKVFSVIFFILLVSGLYTASFVYVNANTPRVLGESVKKYPTTFWQHQCVDTMKYSRDTARAWKGRELELDALIAKQMDAIVELGANCVSLGTPYNEEFVPFVGKWVTAARARNLHVWFRGNLSEFEGWFSYPRLTNLGDHHAKIYSYVTSNPELFQEGDIFTPSPESENRILSSGWGNANTTALKNFLVESFNNCQRAFGYVAKPVQCGYFSSNGDVASKVMDKPTLSKVGNISVIDHYVKDAARMETDIKNLNSKFGAFVFLGEFGAPIPDINGALTEDQQDKLITSFLDVFYRNRKIIRGLNYWTLTGGSTALYNNDLTTHVKAADSIKKYFKPAQLVGSVTENKKPVVGVSVKVDGVQVAVTDGNGSYSLLLLEGSYVYTVGGNGYTSKTFSGSVKIGERVNQAVELNKIK